MDGPKKRTAILINGRTLVQLRSGWQDLLVRPWLADEQ
jgi:hypothetical protein